MSRPPVAGPVLARLVVTTILLVGITVAVDRGVSAQVNPARKIMDEVQQRTTATSQRYMGLLQSFDGTTKTSEKRWAFTRLGAHGTSKVVIRFTAPAEVRGVALLIVNRPDAASDQWMWTPALERDRRIALQDRSTRFFGTDFSFEDLEERDADQFTYRLLPDQVVDGAPCWTVQATPKEAKSSQYSRLILTVRKDRYAVVRIESYVKDDVARRLDYGDFQEIQGIWTARELKMADLRKGSMTRLALEHVEYKVALPEGDFTVQGLRRQS